jgi:hypothetical protein
MTTGTNLIPLLIPSCISGSSGLFGSSRLGFALAGLTALGTGLAGKVRRAYAAFTDWADHWLIFPDVQCAAECLTPLFCGGYQQRGGCILRVRSNHVQVFTKVIALPFGQIGNRILNRIKILAVVWDGFAHGAISTPHQMIHGFVNRIGCDVIELWNPLPPADFRNHNVDFSVCHNIALTMPNALRICKNYF